MTGCPSPSTTSSATQPPPGPGWPRLRRTLPRCGGGSSGWRASSVPGCRPPPTVSGAGTAADPWRAPVLDLAGAGPLPLTLAVEPVQGGPSRLAFGVAFEVAASRGRVEGAATLVAVPLGGTAAIALLPAARVAVAGPAAGSVVDEAAVRVGSVAAGLAWDGERLLPSLVLRDVALDGTAYPSLDLTHASALLAAASAGVREALEEAAGGSRAARALLSLLGLGAPEGDPGWPHALDLSALVESPTRALGRMHRAVLGDPGHGWSHLFAEVAALLGATPSPDGDGSADDPWRATLAEAGAVRLELAGWSPRRHPPEPGACGSACAWPRSGPRGRRPGLRRCWPSTCPPTRREPRGSSARSGSPSPGGRSGRSPAQRAS